jgi:hypothetical protein
LRERESERESEKERESTYHRCRQSRGRVSI